MSDTLRADATPMMRGAVYQLCVAVECCFKLSSGECLTVEEVGDVTLDGDTQIEVKLYNRPLTDNHPNFWNTLYNWTEPTFNSSQFRFLILHTTQEFGAQSQLSHFNSLEPARRMELLIRINQGLERDFVRRSQDREEKPSKTLRQQRELLTGPRQVLLEGILDKVFIEARAATPSQLYARLCEEEARHVLDSNKETYIDALVGFVCRSGMSAGQRWQITCEEFNKQIQTLTSTYCKESRQFPRAEFDRIDLADVDESKEGLFVHKLKEIGASVTHIKKAVRDYEGTTNTIAKEFRQHTSAGMHLRSFTREVVELFEADHESACLAHVHDDSTSMRFYLQTIRAAPPAFPGYADSPANFRNGILHVTMDDHKQDYVWKVVKK